MEILHKTFSFQNFHFHRLSPAFWTFYLIFIKFSLICVCAHCPWLLSFLSIIHSYLYIVCNFYEEFHHCRRVIWSNHLPFGRWLQFVALRVSNNKFLYWMSKVFGLKRKKHTFHALVRFLRLCDMAKNFFCVMDLLLLS